MILLQLMSLLQLVYSKSTICCFSADSNIASINFITRKTSGSFTIISAFPDRLAATFL